MNELKKIFLALDSTDLGQAVQWSKDFSEIGGMKIGLQAYIAGGNELIRQFPNHQIFLDLKLHDIPNTMKGATKSLSKLPLKFVTFHLAAGKQSIEEIEKERQNQGAEWEWIGVSVLTSFTNTDFKAWLGAQEEHKTFVARWMEYALKNGIRNFVCSADEVKEFKTRFPEARFFTPGIRLPGDSADDQGRISTPREAFNNGADYLVMGRALTAQAAAITLEKLKNNLEHKTK